MPRILPRPPWKVLRGSKMPTQMGPVNMSLRPEPEAANTEYQAFSLSGKAPLTFWHHKVTVHFWTLVHPMGD